MKKTSFKGINIKKMIMVLSMMLIMGLYSGVIYANETSEGYNIEQATIIKNDKEVEVLQSKDNGYLKITQIGQNSQNVKVTTSTFNDKILISGMVCQGTELTINIYQDEECQNSYNTLVGLTGSFSQTVDVAEGNNKVFVAYKNSEDGTDNYVAFFIKREATERMEQLKAWVDVPSL